MTSSSRSACFEGEHDLRRLATGGVLGSQGDVGAAFVLEAAVAADRRQLVLPRGLARHRCPWQARRGVRSHQFLRTAEQAAGAGPIAVGTGRLVLLSLEGERALGSLGTADEIVEAGPPRPGLAPVGSAV
jgi:hypothetical protein